MVNTVTEELTCSICLLMLLDPYKIEPCGHTFCNECISEWLCSNLHCPLCRISPTRFRSNSDVVKRIAAVVPKLNVDVKQKVGVIRKQNTSFCFLKDKMTLRKLKTLLDFQVIQKARLRENTENMDVSVMSQIEYELYVQERYSLRQRRAVTLPPCHVCRRCDRPWIDL